MKEMIPLDQVYLLQLSNQGFNLEDFKERKISIAIRSMKLKGLLAEDTSITKAGKDLWDSLFQEGEELSLNKIEKTETDFELFWKAFPSTDTVKQGDKVLFRGSRNLKNDREKCKIKFHQILSEGEYSAQEIISALKYEVQLKIEKSIKEKANKLTYLKNSHAWLTQRSFEAFIEEAKESEIKPIKKSPNWDAIA
jgi:ketosteroid isomerase-like protein